MNDELNDIPESSDPSVGQELSNVGQKAVQAGTQAKNLALGMKNGINNKKNNELKKDDKDKKDGQSSNNDLSNNETSSGLDSVNGLGKETLKKGGEIAKEGLKKTGDGIKKIWNLIPKPYNWFILGGLVLLLLVFLIIFMVVGSDSEGGTCYVTGEEWDLSDVNVNQAPSYENGLIYWNSTSNQY